MKEIDSGLEGIVVGATAISNVDGDAGRLSYRGLDIEILAAMPFLQVVWLLLFGARPQPDEEEALAQYLASHAPLGDSDRQLLEAVPSGTHPMLMLQGLVPLLDLEPRATAEFPISTEDSLHGLIIAARLPTLVAAYHRREAGLDWPLMATDLQPHRAFLANLHGTEPTDNQVAVIDAAQILQMEHSFNAGTFAGRVTLSTRAPIQASIATSLGTLFGQLHGGADQAALEMAMQVGDPQAAPAFVAQSLQSGKRIMGMGHREYRTVDPRATLLKPLARSVCRDAESKRLLATLEAIEAACVDQLGRPGRGIAANVEFYKGAVFHALGIKPRYFTALFAMARVYGYIAHALEFRPQSRLIRPRAFYTGPATPERRGFKSARSPE